MDLGTVALHSSLSEADKISKLETTQNTCCAKNAELEARLELLEKKYEEINEVCKTKSSDGRRLATAAGCGGLFSWTQNKPTIKAQGRVQSRPVVKFL